MNKCKAYYFVIIILFMVLLVGCNKSIVSEETTITSYMSQIEKTIFNYYPNCELTVSPSNFQNNENDSLYNVDCNVSLPDGTNIITTIYYNNNGWFPDRYYVVYMERNFDNLNEIGFNEYNLNLLGDCKMKMQK